jgi:hypothetical protein
MTSEEGRAEEELALLQILQRGGVLVGVCRQAACDRRRVARLVTQALNRIDNPVDVLLPVPTKRDQEHGRVVVRRDEAAFLVVRHDARRPADAKFIGKRGDSRTRRRCSDIVVVGPHDDDLADLRLARSFPRKALGKNPFGLLRLGLPRDLGLALKLEEHRHEHDRGEDRDQP